MRYLAPLLTLLLAACAGSPPSPAQAPLPEFVPFCAAAQPIEWHDDDTDKTIAQIKSITPLASAYAAGEKINE